MVIGTTRGIKTQKNTTFLSLSLSLSKDWRCLDMTDLWITAAGGRG